MSRLLCASLTVLFAAAVVVASSAADEPALRTGEEKAKPNRLARESSPYLLQHAHNPVDWHPWSPEAFARAKKENKLIFLSIGYSSCHWCHVMERESFSNVEIAKALNDNFVCIKVDREERPDVDDVYMTALHVSGESGGWPLTMILTSDGKPIFGGTYFPPDDKKVGEGTLPGMKSILATVVELNKKEHDGLLKQADKIAELTAAALERNASAVALIKPDRSMVDGAAAAFDFDPVHGGTGNKAAEFKGAKFPRPTVWSFLLTQAARPGHKELAGAAELTLRNLAGGGIYDHLGGGFHRYSTERTWTVPHFEKMLYDNAQLVELYSQAYRQNKDSLYGRVVAETVVFVKRELTNPEGVFYSALDADSNQREGEYYVWTQDEVKAVLGADAAFFLEIYGGPTPNFEGRHWVLRLARPLAETAREKKLSEAELLGRIEPLKAKLLAAREKRPRPFRDTKVIAGWNGQMIAGLAKAGQVFEDKDYIQTAAKAADFVLANMRTADGRLYRLWGAAPGEKAAAHGVAFLDDYAYVVHGLLNLHDATGDAKWLNEARALADKAIAFHGDGPRGGFFFTPSDGEKLFARSKDSYDGVQPSGNSQMARNLLRLWQKTKVDAYRDRCLATLKLFSLSLRTSPGSMPTMALTLEEWLDATGDTPGSQPLAKDAPKKPRESADVVMAVLKLGEPTSTGDRPFTLALTITPGWHIYANPAGNEMLAESRTEVTASRGKATVTYPKGKEVKDPITGPYAIYDGTVTITGTLPAGKDEVELRVKVNACSDDADGKPGVCLKTSTLVVKP